MVIDQGPGVAPRRARTHLRALLPGPHVGPSGATDGTGLGLSLVAEHVRLHGGRVWVEDGAGDENRFVVELPAPTATRRHHSDPRSDPGQSDEGVPPDSDAHEHVLLAVGPSPWRRGRHRRRRVRCARRPLPRRTAAQRRPFRALATLPPSTTTTSAASPVQAPVQIFLVSSSGHLMAVTREVPPPRIRWSSFWGPHRRADQHRGGSGPPERRPRPDGGAGGVIGAEGTRHGEPGGTFGQLVGQAQIQAVAQVVFTATAVPGVPGVTFELTGKRWSFRSPAAPRSRGDPGAVRAARPRLATLSDSAALPGDGWPGRSGRASAVSRRMPTGAIVGPDDRGERRPTDARGRSRPRLLVEDMDEKVAVVHEDPPQIAQSLHRVRRPTRHQLHPPLDLVDERPHLSVLRPCVITKASVTPSRSPTARTTVDSPNFSSAARAASSAAVGTAGPGPASTGPMGTVMRRERPRHVDRPGGPETGDR